LPESVSSRRVYLGIPFYEKRKPIDFVSGLERYKARIREQITQEATEKVMTLALAQVSELFKAAPYGGAGGILKTGTGSGKITPSLGAGFRGGSSPAAQAILSAAAKAKKQSLNKSTTKRK
jgi:hypothetical protein